MGKLIALIGLICAVWVIYDVWDKQKQMETPVKIIWTLAAIVFNFFTAIIYYLVVKRRL